MISIKISKLEAELLIKVIREIQALQDANVLLTDDYLLDVLSWAVSVGFRCANRVEPKEN